MGVYIRKDSPYFWMLLERPEQPPIYKSTKVPVAAHSLIQQKRQRQDAEDIYAARMADLARTRHQLPAHDPEVTTFKMYAAWWETHVLPRRRGKDRDAVALKHLLKHFGPVDLTAINRPGVQEYITERLKTVKPNTVNREVDVLKGMLRDAVPKYLTVSPLVRMKKLRIVKPPKQIMAPADERRLLAAMHTDTDRAFYIVAVDTLIRLQNVCDLRWDDVKAGHLELVDSKTGPYRVPLSTRARKALKALPRTSVYCFPTRRVAKNQRDWRGAIRLMLQRACARCEPPIPYGRGIGRTFHTATRATGATRMLRAGFDPRTVQAVGNWKDFRAMQEYLQPDSAHLKAAVDAIAPSVPRNRPKAKIGHKRLSKEMAGHTTGKPKRREIAKK